MPLIDSIHSLYDELRLLPEAPPIHPFVGQHYLDASPEVLRILVMGVNCYYEEQPPSRDEQQFPSWMRDRRFIFFARAFSESAVIAEALAGSAKFASRRSAGLEALYVTNMVRRYLPGTSGKRASSVREELLDEGAEVWKAELDLLSEAGVLPHVVIVFGDKIWYRAWNAFGARVGTKDWIESYQPCAEASELYHRLNHVVVREKDTRRSLLLVKLPHPSARSDAHRAAWIASHPDFRQVAGLDGASGSAV